MSGGGPVAMGPLIVGTGSWGALRCRLPSARAGIRATVGAALDEGLCAFDTPASYGLGAAMALLGEALAHDVPSRAVVLTKFLPVGLMGRPRGLQRRVLRHLDAMGRERIEVYQLHWPLLGLSTHWLDALQGLHEEGLVGSVGVCNVDSPGLRTLHGDLRRRGVGLTSVQLGYSLLDRSAARTGLIATCRSLGIPVLAYRPLAGGLLARPGAPSGRAGGPALDRILAAIDSVAREHQASRAQVALAWVVHKGLLPIVGLAQPTHLRESLAGLGLVLSPSQARRLDLASSSPVAEGRP